jgi:hypothetical protein
MLRIGTIRAPWTSAAEARASARFKVCKVEAVEKFEPRSFASVKRRKRRAPVAGGKDPAASAKQIFRLALARQSDGIGAKSGT